MTTPYSFKTLTTAINNIKPVSRFILDTVYKPNQNFANIIEVDKIEGAKTLAPFVAPMQGAKILKKLGQSTQVIKLPRIRIKKAVSAKDLLLTKDAGQNIYIGSAADIAKAKQQKIARELEDLKNRTVGRHEWMAARSLSGSISYEDDDLKFNIDFGMPSENKPVLSGNNVWGGSTSDILKNIRAYKKMILNATGSNPDLAILGSDAVDKFLADEKIQKLLDNRSVAIGTVKVDNTNYLGKVLGVDFYEYGEKYVDENGDAQDLIDAGAVVFINTKARFVHEFGVIEDLEAEGAVAQQFFSKMWEEKDPSGLFLLSESNSLPIPYQPDAVVYATVC